MDTMDLPKYRVPWRLKRAVQQLTDPSFFGSCANHFGRRNKYLKVLKALKSANQLIDMEDYHLRQLLRLGLYLEEYEGSGRTREIKEYCTVQVEKVKRSPRQFKICISEHWFRAILKVTDRLTVFEEGFSVESYLLNIEKICEDWVIVRAPANFCQLNDSCHGKSQKFKAEIVFSNNFFQRCHGALDAISPSTISQCFYPNKADTHFNESNRRKTWFNVDIWNDPEQTTAVCNIIVQSAFPAPYILYGPPGTGKTSTLVETACQIWQEQSPDCILICAVSDVACDVITKRLLNYIPNTSSLLRLYSEYYNYNKIDEDIKKISNYNDKTYCDALNKIDISIKKIIITTLHTAWRLQPFQMSFSHLFIDEANQATEIETLIPLSLLKPSDRCQIVISGDNQSLGPDYFRSTLAWKFLGQSILQKLVKHELYKKSATNGYDPRYITKLIRNYRNHKDITHVSNELFYNGEIVACGSKENMGTVFEAINFNPVKGTVHKTLYSKSSYNYDEVSEVLLLVERFIGKQLKNKTIQGRDIGIVTQHSVQVSKIQEELKKKGLEDVDVGDVDAYQGREKEVIIISTVKTKLLGYYWTARRFNVAVTRARMNLTIVGDPRALQINIFWWNFLKFYQSKNFNSKRTLVINDKFGYASRKVSVEDDSYKSSDLFDEEIAHWKIDNESGVVNFYYRYGSFIMAMIFVFLIMFTSTIVLVGLPDLLAVIM